MKSKLTPAHSRLIRKAQKTLDGFRDLDDMADNALSMSVLIGDLIKVIEKIDTSDQTLQENLEKATKRVGELKTENKRLDDAGKMLIKKLNKTDRKERTKKHQHWQDNHHYDAQN